MYWGPIFLLRNPLSPFRATIFDKKCCWEFCTFLSPERISRYYGIAMAPPHAPSWSNLLSGDHKWSSRTLTVFFFWYFVCFFFWWGGGRGVGRGVFVVTSAFKSFILKLDMGNSIFCSRLTSCTVTVHNVQSFDWVSVKIVGTLNCLLTLPIIGWCATFGELTAMNNIGWTRRRARSKNSTGWKCPNYFCLRR